MAGANSEYRSLPSGIFSKQEPSAQMGGELVNLSRYLQNKHGNIPVIGHK